MRREDVNTCGCCEEAAAMADDVLDALRQAWRERDEALAERDRARDLAAALEAELARTPRRLDLTRVADDTWGGTP